MAIYGHLHSKKELLIFAVKRKINFWLIPGRFMVIPVKKNIAVKLLIIAVKRKINFRLIPGQFMVIPVKKILLLNC